ncbi:MAG: LysR family transcriptional regulator [Bdellovibrionaceae bacterium]|jgi:LysR family transcriptional regulator, cell division regulator|nr:LysR family transcriptional regulator [Pseudobdellovibrionaceae bacterium]
MISAVDLKYFMEVAKLNHVSKAAHRLGVTQPTLSHCLKKIEEDLGAELFVRTKKGVYLTAAGERFYNQAQILEENWMKVYSSVKDEVEAAVGTIRLGSHTAVAKYMLPPLLPNFINEFPKIQIQLSHGLSRVLNEKIITNKIDVAFVVNPMPHPDLVIKQVCRDVVTLWCPKKLINKQTLLIEPSLLQTQDVLKKLSKIKMNFSNIIESASLEVIAQLMFSGTGYAILPQRVVESFDIKKVVAIKGAPIFKDRICLVFKPEFIKTQRGRLFVDAVNSIAF